MLLIISLWYSLCSNTDVQVIVTKFFITVSYSELKHFRFQIEVTTFFANENFADIVLSLSHKDYTLKLMNFIWI